MTSIFETTGPVWLWAAAPPAKGSWHFLTIDPQTSVEIRYEALGRTGGFGSIKVGVTIEKRQGVGFISFLSWRSGSARLGVGSSGS